MKASPLHRFCESADAAELKLYILNDVPSFQKVLLKERFLLGFLRRTFLPWDVRRTSGISLANIWQISGKSWENLGNISNVYWKDLGKISSKFRENFGQILSKSRETLGQISGKSWANLEQI